MSNEIRFNGIDKCKITYCPALTGFCNKSETANMIFDTNWHALCNQDVCKSLPRFPIAPPVASLSDVKVNPKCTLKPFYMQKNDPPLHMLSDCYTNGSPMKKEADGAWTLHFKGTHAKCSTEIKRVELNNWPGRGFGIFDLVVLFLRLEQIIFLERH